jgi:sortase A
MPSQKREEKVTKPLLRLIGTLLLFFGTFIFIKIYFPVAKAELSYQFIKHESVKEITPVDPSFSIIIPKININSKVIKNVDPKNSAEYQKALTKGVAHAKSSALPGFPGNVFIFAHSATNWVQANQYNAVFYLTNKLDVGDQVYLYYDNSKYTYSVTEKRIVDSTDTAYLNNDQSKRILTLMTCWPPGTTLKRLVIIAKSL